jgi:hypothetical protein
MGTTIERLVYVNAMSDKKTGMNFTPAIHYNPDEDYITPYVDDTVSAMDRLVGFNSAMDTRYGMNVVNTTVTKRMSFVERVVLALAGKNTNKGI